MTLWNIHYYVNLCLDNLDREKTKVLAEQEHQDQIKKLETDIRNKAKLKLSMTNKAKQNQQKNEEVDDDDENSDENDIIPPAIHQQDDDDEDDDLLDIPDMPDGLASTSLAAADFSPLPNDDHIEEYDLDNDFDNDLDY